MVQTQISAQKSSVRLCKLGSSYFDGAEQLSPEQKAQELANQAVELLNALKEAKALDALKTAKVRGGGAAGVPRCVGRFGLPNRLSPSPPT